MQEAFENISVTERTMPWGRIGTVFNDKNRPQSATEACELAGLDWGVELVKSGYQSGTSWRVNPGNFTTVRTDTGVPLGTVKSRYQPFQNDAAFQLCDEIAHHGGTFEAAWEHNGGKEVGITMRFGEDLLIGGEDPVGTYLLFRNSHDGSTSIGGVISMIQLGCLNQTASVFRKASNRFSFVHSKNASGRIQAAREALDITLAYQETYQKEMEQLLNRSVVEKQANGILDGVLTKLHVSEKVRDRDIEAINSLRQNSTTINDDVRNTAYGFEAAVTEYFDHYRNYRTEASAYISTTRGIGARVRNAVHHELVLA